MNLVYSINRDSPIGSHDRLQNDRVRLVNDDITRAGSDQIQRCNTGIEVYAVKCFYRQAVGHKVNF